MANQETMQAVNMLKAKIKTHLESVYPILLQFQTSVELDVIKKTGHFVFTNDFLQLGKEIKVLKECNSSEIVSIEESGKRNFVETRKGGFSLFYYEISNDKNTAQLSHYLNDSNIHVSYGVHGKSQKLKVGDVTSFHFYLSDLMEIQPYVIKIKDAIILAEKMEKDKTLQTLLKEYGQFYFYTLEQYRAITNTPFHQ